MVNEEIEYNFEGFIAPDGELVPIQDADRMFSIFVRGRENRDEIVRSLRSLAQECVDSNYYKTAYDYFEKIISLTDAPGEKAECLVRMGVVMEQSGNYQAALEAYLRAFELPQKSNEVWYYLNNNTGYCLNQTGQHQEAEKYCRAAIGIAPDRHNAYKNLGIALQNQGLYADAAKNYIHATKLCPTDNRALAHLKDLISGHREILGEIPDLMTLLHECHEAVQAMKGKSFLQ